MRTTPLHFLPKKQNQNQPIKPKPRNHTCIIFLIYLTECFQEPGRSEDKIMGRVSRKWVEKYIKFMLCLNSSHQGKYVLFTSDVRSTMSTDSKLYINLLSAEIASYRFSSCLGIVHVPELLQCIRHLKTSWKIHGVIICYLLFRENDDLWHRHCYLQSFASSF